MISLYEPKFNERTKNGKEKVKMSMSYEEAIVKVAEAICTMLAPANPNIENITDETTLPPMDPGRELIFINLLEKRGIAIDEDTDFQKINTVGKLLKLAGFEK